MYTFRHMECTHSERRWLPNRLSTYPQESGNNVAVAGITETRLPGSDLSQVEGATIIQSGGQDHTVGVALVLQPPFNKNLISWRSVSSRLLHARLSHRHGHVSVVVAYAPLLYDIPQWSLRSILIPAICQMQLYSRSLTSCDGRHMPSPQCK